MKVTEWRGAEGLVYAEVTKDDNASGGYVTGEVKSLAGLAKVTRTTSSDNEPKYYDNAPAFTITAEGADEVGLDVSAIDVATLAEITGQYYDDATGMLVEGSREEKYFALGYKTKKVNGDEVYVWRLKGSFAIPDEESSTENDGTDAVGQSLTYTGIKTTHKFNKTGKGAKAVVVDVAAGLADVETFFDAVTTPDTLKAKTTS